MALRLQAIGGGAVRVVPGNTGKILARRRAAALGLSGVRVMGRTGETRPGAGLSLGGIIRGVGKTITGFLGGGPIGGATALGDVLTGGGGARGTDFGGMDLVGDCPSGFRRDASGQCVRAGAIGTIQRALPFGETGTLGDVSGEAVIGGFGLPARVPAQVGTVTRNDGTVSPILRCPRRMVLGFDNLCYPKALLGPRSRFRKHRRPVKPPLSSGDVRAIRRARSVRDDVKDLADSVGFQCTNRPGAPSRKKKKS